MNLIQPTKAIELLSKNQDLVLEYKSYWKNITPADNEEVSWRYIFAFLSVHTSWSANVNAYYGLQRNRHRWNDPAELERLIQLSGVGLHKIRTKGISDFLEKFSVNPEYFKLLPNEDWQTGRNRIMKDCFGLGYAKTAFALEMCNPLESEAVCLDTHGLQLYGYTPKDINKGIKKTEYLTMEKHWSGTCLEYNIPPYIARCLFWDMKQNKTDSRYWSFVFEEPIKIIS